MRKLKPDDLIIEINCFKGENYRWFRLPHPMTKEQAEAWAKKNINMPIEAYKVLEAEKK